MSLINFLQIGANSAKFTLASRREGLEKPNRMAIWNGVSTSCLDSRKI